MEPARHKLPPLFSEQWQHASAVTTSAVTTSDAADADAASAAARVKPKAGLFACCFRGSGALKPSAAQSNARTPTSSTEGRRRRPTFDSDSLDELIDSLDHRDDLPSADEAMRNLGHLPPPKPQRMAWAKSSKASYKWAY